MRQLHSLHLSVISTASWIFCFHLGKLEAQHASELDRDIAATKYDPEAAKVSNHLYNGVLYRVYKENHDSIISSKEKHGILKEHILPKTVVQRTNDLSVIERENSLKTILFILKTSSSKLPVTYHSHDSGEKFTSIDNKKQHEKSPFNCENWLCKMCSKLMTQRTCEKLILSPKQRNNSLTYTSWFQQRKLLQESGKEVKKAKESVHEASNQSHGEEDMVTIREEVIVIKQTDNEKNDTKRMARLTWLIDELRRDVSKEPMWAMISVSVLMLVLVLASKACGLRVIHREQEIHVDVEEDFHNVSVMEVIRVKKRYLPKSFLRFKQRLQRKFRRKPRKIKEKDICEPLSDSSEEERLLYDRANPV